MLDSAVQAFGSALESELKSVEGKNHREIEAKSTRILRKWLPDAPSSQRFRDPARKVEL